MRVDTVKEAWDLAARLFPSDYALDSSSVERAGYEIYKSTAEGSNARICDLGARLELNYDNGLSENIWIDEKMEEDNVIDVGMYTEKTVFGEVKVREVRDITYHYALGMVIKTLDDGRPGIEISLGNGETASFGLENVAYIRFGRT